MGINDVFDPETLLKRLEDFVKLRLMSVNMPTTPGNVEHLTMRVERLHKEQVKGTMSQFVRYDAILDRATVDLLQTKCVTSKTDAFIYAPTLRDHILWALENPCANFIFRFCGKKLENRFVSWLRTKYNLKKVYEVTRNIELVLPPPGVDLKDSSVYSMWLYGRLQK